MTAKTFSAVSGTLLALLIATQGVNAKDTLTLKPVLEETNIEMFSPVFVGTGLKQVALVRQDVTAPPKNSGSNPRFADPKIELVTVANSKKQFVDYGWNPAPSKDGKLMFYVQQTNPFGAPPKSGIGTRQGNKIFCFDLANNTKKELAAPSPGYPDSTLLSADGTKLAYGLFEKGPGGEPRQIGVGIYDIAAGTNQIVITPAKQGDSHILYDKMLWIKDRLVMARLKPSGKLYTADVIAIQGSKAPVVLHKFKQTQSFEWQDYQLSASPQGQVQVYVGGTLHKIDPASAKVLAAVTPAKEPSGQIVRNADQRLMARYDRDTLTISNTATKKNATFTVGENRQISEMVWSPDSKTLMIVMGDIANLDSDKPFPNGFKRIGVYIIAVPPALL